MPRSMAGCSRPLPLAIRVALAGLLAAIAFVGCSTAAATPGDTSMPGS
jgi:hypothetical protein